MIRKPGDLPKDRKVKTWIFDYRNDGKVPAVNKQLELFYLSHIFKPKGGGKLSAFLKAKIEGVWLKEGASRTLKNINLEVYKGEFVVITGPMGSGKSILCHCLTGAIPNFYDFKFLGEVMLKDQSISQQKLPQLAGKIGYMMQDPQSQIFSTTVEEDVAFGPGNLCLPLEEIQARTNEALNLVGLKGFNKRAPETLSGGEAQRVVLAGLTALDSELYILDQPTSELDPNGKKDLYERLAALNQDFGKTIILVEDRLEDIVKHASRVLYLDKGEIVADEQAEKVKKIPLFSHFFGNLEHVSSKRIQEFYPAGETKSKAYCVNKTVEFINCHYNYPNGHKALADINLSLYPGELVALLGHNGSGKTTLAKHIIGLLRPTQGQVLVNRFDTKPISVSKLSQKVGFLFQNPDYQIFANTISEEITFTLKVKGVSRKDIPQRVEKVLQDCELLNFKDIHPYTLSRGQRQLLALASLFAGDSPIMVVDEPTSGLNRQKSLLIMEKFHVLSRKGKSIVIITHDVELALKFSDRVVLMDKGRIELDLPTTEFAIQKNPLLDII